MTHSIGWYDDHARDLVARYEAVDPASLLGWLRGLLPDPPGTVLDIGAGSGRDAAWFSAQGYDVIAVEPSSGMRAEGQRLRPDPRIRWIGDELPELGVLGRLAISFDVVMMTAVWQHVLPSQRDRAFRKTAALVRSGGLLATSLRSGPSPAGSGMHSVSLEEVERLARNHGFAVEKVEQAPDRQGRAAVSWAWVALRLPDDGTGALPLLRHVILNDQKSATYKLGLLRALCRAADGSAGMVQDTGDEFVRVPLGLVALNWLRLYLPLIREGLPQTPTNVGAQGLGFAKAGFQNLVSGIPASDLRIATRFTLDRAQSLHAALRDAAQTIDRMPSTFIHDLSEGGRILPVERGRPGGAPGTVVLDAGYLAAFGWMSVPSRFWRAMRWSDPARDVSRVREIAIGMLETDNLRCTWTDRPLGRNTLDIDHLFPWRAWPCGDFWNLLPAHREVNQRLKRDRLPSATRLFRAEGRIIRWWKQAYLVVGAGIPGQGRKPLA